ncbi:MAG: hypothetical protein OXI92_15050, partial [Acidobacteriota bacterium]|nr:hypothetical protein [Acidobacteriota bacterium]
MILADARRRDLIPSLGTGANAGEAVRQVNKPEKKELSTKTHEERRRATKGLEEVQTGSAMGRKG